MLSDSDNVAILISSPGCYRDVFEIFWIMFKKNWPDCPYPVYLATDEEWSMDDEGPNVLICEPGVSWSRRVLNSLDQISAEYIILVTDDCFISAPVDTSSVNSMLRAIAEHDVCYCRLHASFIKANDKRLEGERHLYHISARTPYGRNLLAAVWQTGYLKEVIGDGSSTGWDIENRWLFEALSAQKNEPLERCAADDRNILNIVHGVAQGKWLPEALKLFKKQGISTDKFGRESLLYGQYLQMKLKKFFGSRLSPGIRTRTKAVLSRMGMKFVTKY